MFSQRTVPVVETQLEGTFEAALDKYINVALVPFILHPSSITLIVTANAYTLPPHFDQFSASSDDSIHPHHHLIPCFRCNEKHAEHWHP